MHPIRKTRGLRCALVTAGLALVLLQPPAGAVQPGEELADPRLETRARAISAGLRCLVCQNQSIDDSDAPLAKDLRLLVRERLKAGDSDRAVEDYVVARYGEFVLLKPPFGLHTLALWIAPLLALAAAILAVSRGLSWSRTQPAPAELSAEEQRRLKEIEDRGA